METCKILIIDDDQEDVEILSDAFQSSGVDSVHYVYTAMQAFMYLEKVVHQELPKLIVTDMYMPGMSGAEFLKDLKGMEPYKHIHTIVLSSTKNEQEMERYRLVGEVEYLIKPSSYEEYKKVAHYLTSKLKE
ncbi:MAG TPA: response regulator [Chitinophagaceae bacterium]|jgi:CheY-like chemotaxis protein|nr:response regulator [Chitinophagaceae bacterium]